MPKFGPVKRTDFIPDQNIFMMKNDITVRIPNPHEGDIGRELLSRILRQAKIDKPVWEAL